ncbi:MAG: RICIN domain-containing protein [Acidimicrobiia bacterium]|nr:RICIN domain-containing protein [Acidimicrobiia bacterium]
MKTDHSRNRKLSLATICVAGAALFLNPFSGSAPAAETPQLQGFQLVAGHSGKAAAVTGGSNADGAAVVQLTPSNLNSQGWVPLPFGNSWVLVNLNSNKVLDVQGQSTANGAAVIQQGWAGTASQVWTLSAFGPGHTVFINFASQKAMDVAGASVANGAPLIQWDWNGGASQIWRGVAVGVPASTTTTRPTTTTTRPSTTTTTIPSGTSLDGEEVAFCRLINDYRAQNGVGPLLVSSSLTNAANWLSNDMAEKNYVNHTDSLGRQFPQRFAAFGYPYAGGENIAAGTSTGQAAFDLWKSDTSHNAIMLSPSYTVMGIGRAYQPTSTYGWYWTNTFGVTDDGGTPCP